MQISSILTTLMLLIALIIRIVLIVDKIDRSDCVTASFKTTESATYSTCELGVKYFLDSYGKKTGYAHACDASYTSYLNTFACIAREFSTKNIAMLVGSLFLTASLAFSLLFGRDWLLSRFIATFSLWLALNGTLFSPLFMVIGSTIFAILADFILKIVLKLSFIVSKSIDITSSPFRSQKRTPKGRFSP